VELYFLSFFHSITIVLANKGRLVIHRDMSSENNTYREKSRDQSHHIRSQVPLFRSRGGGGLNHVSEPETKPERLERGGPC
jgi:hypothetical protein